MRNYGKLGVLAALLMTSPACVPLSQYTALEQRFDEQEAYVLAHKSQVRDLERREQQMTLRAGEQEKQLELLRARLEKSERLRSRMERDGEATPVLASAPVQQEAPKVMGLEVNPATQGLVLESGLLFASGHATLKEGGKQLLDRLAKELNGPKYKDHRVRIDGHTDDAPIKHSKHESNWDLSAKRALSVLHHLESRGVAPDRLFFAGFGPHEPLEAASQPKNRRVEIVLFER